MWDELGGPQKPGGCYFYSFCSIARAYMMSFWIEVRSSAHSQVLCLTAVLKRKKKKGLELCDRSGNEQPSLYCNKHTTQTCRRSVLSAQCLFTRGNPEIQRSQMDYSGCVVAHKLEKALRFFNRGNLIKQKSVPPPTETQCLSCCLQSPANCNTTSLLLALLGHACH